MLYEKKISSDVLHVALILVFIRMGPDLLWSNPLHDTLIIGDIFIGPAIAYQQYYSHDSFTNLNRYENLKNRGADFIDHLTLLRDRLNYFSHRSSQNFIAYYSDGVDSHQDEQRIASTNTNGEVNESVTNSNDSVIDDFSDSSAGQAFENLVHSANIDLSREDMDLIEILWKQDIDIGVSREAFSLFDGEESEKVKSGTELSEDAKEFPVEETNIKPHSDFDDDDVSFYKECESLCYTIDSETGEHIIQEQKISEELNENPADNNLFSLRGFEEASPNIFTSKECEDLSLAEAQKDNRPQFRQPFEATVFPNSGSIFDTQAEKLEDFVRSSEALLYQHENERQVGEEMYPSMEEYWQDISNTLPLSVMGIGSYQSGFSRTGRVLSDVIENESASFASEVIQHPLSNDIFVEALYQNASLIQRSQEMNNSFSYVSDAAMDVTSLGCAVATSIATLTNDSEPVPDICNNINGTCGLDLVNMLRPNTSAVSPNESLISDILLEEDLQLMTVGATVDESTSGRSVAKLFQEQVDLSSDSINSSTSGNISSISECKCVIRKGVEVTCTGTHKKESHFGQKNGVMTETMTHLDQSLQNADTDLTPSQNGINCSYYLQHNHSYHLPFIAENNSPKPITRDKTVHFRSEEENTRDEKRAKALKLPISIDEIINLAIDEFNEKLSKFELTEPQLTLIRDIRRRGKNKVAAQNCRKRKMDQICILQQDIDLLSSERTQLETQREKLLQQRQNVEDKYSQLCQLVFQNPCQAIGENDFTSNLCQETGNTQPSSLPCSPTSDFIFQGVRTKRKLGKKKIDFT